MGCAPALVHAWSRPCFAQVSSTLKRAGADPAATYLAPRAWIKMISYDDEHGASEISAQLTKKKKRSTHVKQPGPKISGWIRLVRVTFEPSTFPRAPSLLTLGRGGTGSPSPSPSSSQPGSRPGSPGASRPGAGPGRSGSPTFGRASSPSVAPWADQCGVVPKTSPLRIARREAVFS